MSMRSVFFLTSITFICFLSLGAKTHLPKNSSAKNKEMVVLKKEIFDKRLSSQRKYTLTVLAARELGELNYKKEALEYYQIAKDINVDYNKNEITMALSGDHSSNSLFFFEVHLKTLLKSKSYEMAILSLNPEKLSETEYARYRIIYDLLNVKLRKRQVKKLYCYKDYQKDPETYYQYSNLLCDMLVEYLRDGKLGSDHLKVIEEYFFKHDLKERYLLQLAKDLKI